MNEAAAEIQQPYDRSNVKYSICSLHVVQYSMLQPKHFNNARPTNERLHFVGYGAAYGTSLFINKVITTMVIRPLDDRTYCARSAFTHLGFWPKLYDCSRYHFTASEWFFKWPLLTFSSISIRPFVCNLKGVLFDSSD